jgi:hypothetical protein
MPIDQNFYYHSLVKLTECKNKRLCLVNRLSAGLLASRPALFLCSLVAMKRLLPLLFLLCSLVAQAQKNKSLVPSPRALDEKYGFRDVRFETDTTAITGLKLLSRDKETSFYLRPSDSKKIGEAELNTIVYAFYKGHLMCVMLKAKGEENATTLLDVFTAQYGAPQKTGAYLVKYQWDGQKSYIMYESSKANGETTIRLYSRIMAKQMVADQKEKAKSASADL